MALLAFLLMFVGAPLEQGDVTMGQVHDEGVELAALIERVRNGSATLALVTLATPAHVARDYPVAGGGGKKCEPYRFIEYRGTLERVVAAGHNTPKLKVGPLAIVPANVPDLVHLSRLECVEGTSKSPIWPSYSGAAPTPGARRLVFLTHDRRYGWRELVSGAWLDADELVKVEQALKRPASD